MRLLVANGPNLNLLGKREPGTYGRASLSDLERSLGEAFPGHEIDFFQTNHEGALIDRLHAADVEGYVGIVLNPGGWTHTSVALRDAVAAIDVPVVEVHLSNVNAREPFRHTSLTAGVCLGQISGLGLEGYRLAIEFLIRRADGDRQQEGQSPSR